MRGRTPPVCCMLGVGTDCVCGEVNKWNFTFYNKVTVFPCDNQRSKKMPEIIEAETLAEQFIALGLDKSIEVGTKFLMKIKTVEI